MIFRFGNSLKRKIKNHHSRHYGGNEGCYLLLVGVSMKKPIRDNWYIIIIKHSVNESMNGTLLITKKCIRKVLCNFA